MQAGTKHRNGRSRRVARTLRCQSAVESPQRSSRPYLGAHSFWKRNIKLTRKGIERAPGFREVVTQLVLRKPRMDKTGYRFPVFVRDCGRQLGQQFWRCLKGSLRGTHAYNKYSGWCFVYYNLPCLSYKPGGPAWISLSVTSTPRVPCTTSHVTPFSFLFFFF